MHVEAIREFGISFPEVTEGFPFGENLLVLKAGGKMFMIISLEDIPQRINVKGDPEDNVQYREEYPEAVLPGYHMNKEHWNTVLLDGSVPDKILKKFITDSYNLVYKKKKNKA